MCGIFGVSVTESASITRKVLRAAVDDLFKLSESRGKEAAGVAVLNDAAIHVYKEPTRASTMIRRPEYEGLFLSVFAGGPAARDDSVGRPVTIIGHSRLVTTGRQENRLNNQPVTSSGAVGIHNGIIVNDEALWRAHPSMQRQGEVDSEVILALIRKFCSDGLSLIQAVRETFRQIEGAASIAVLFNDLDVLVLATNNGSLYVSGDQRRGAVIFASEEYILRTLIGRRYLVKTLGSLEISPVRPGFGCLVDLRDLGRQSFAIMGVEDGSAAASPRIPPRQVIDVLPRGRHGAVDLRSAAAPRMLTRSFPPPEHPNQSAIDRLRRCARCILPETMPFIEFDEAGVCNYCRGYRKIEPRGLDALEQIVSPHRRDSGRPDCLVGLSGGRDSTYGLHYIKTVLKMNPIAYTYDWGMVTDLARRNISRICGKLGVEHILISADIEKKRRFIRKNVSAWLKRPDLGIIPLFMAGDKQYFYFAKKLKQQTGVPLILLCENMLERTDFKTGFCGVPPGVVGEDHAYTLPMAGKVKLAAYYGRQYLLNPAYLNASVPDTLFAYACYYLISRDYVNLYRYIEWDEAEIRSTLIREYDWELATDTQSFWRIGDGTASFYNYIYYTIAGFTENETFRSNQIRQGVITRERALELARVENRPRWETIHWYLDTIGLGEDFAAVIKRINSIPTLYPR